MYQGMFAIITPALISGAVAERIRFGPYCLFILLWVTLVYCPLAHWVWACRTAPNAADAGRLARRKMGALDFAGGTVVHIAAGFSGLAAILVLRKRHRLSRARHAPQQHGADADSAPACCGSAGSASTAAAPWQATAWPASAFAASQVAAAAAGLSWMLAEWLHQGKPTALGLASGLVAGLVAVTPASGFVMPAGGGLVIGLIAGVVCYVAVCLKPIFKYDDSLDAFGVHGVGGFLGAVLTGVFCYEVAGQRRGTAAPIGLASWPTGSSSQVGIQFIAAVVAAAFAFVVTLVLVKVIDLAVRLLPRRRGRERGPRPHRARRGRLRPRPGAGGGARARRATSRGPPWCRPTAQKRFTVVVEGADNGELMHAWSELCQPAPSRRRRSSRPSIRT